MLWLEKYFRENPDEFVPLGGPGMRNTSQATLQYRISRVPVFCHSKSGECVSASIANALHAVGHDDSAEAVLRKGKFWCGVLEKHRNGLSGTWEDSDCARSNIRYW